MGAGIQVGWSDLFGWSKHHSSGAPVRHQLQNTHEHGEMEDLENPHGWFHAPRFTFSVPCAHTHQHTHRLCLRPLPHSLQAVSGTGTPSTITQRSACVLESPLHFRSARGDESQGLCLCVLGELMARDADRAPGHQLL